MIIDTFCFFQKLDLLEIRLEYLYPFVDKFIIVEACQTFKGELKPYNYEKNKERFSKYADKIIYFKIRDFHKSTDALFNYLKQSKNIERNFIYDLLLKHNFYDKNKINWLLDSYHRECIHLKLREICSDDDIVIISDLDEIPSLKGVIEMVKNREIKIFPFVCNQIEFKYFLNSLSNKNWYGSIISPYSLIKENSFNFMRHNCKNIC